MAKRISGRAVGDFILAHRLWAVVVLGLPLIPVFSPRTSSLLTWLVTLVVVLALGVIGQSAVLRAGSGRARIGLGALFLLGMAAVMLFGLWSTSGKSQPSPPTRELIATYERVTSNYADAPNAVEVTIQTTDTMPDISLSVACDRQISGASVGTSGFTTALFEGIDGYSDDGKVYWFSYQSPFRQARSLVVTLSAKERLTPLWVTIGDSRSNDAESPAYPVRPSRGPT